MYKTTTGDVSGKGHIACFRIWGEERMRIIGGGVGSVG